MSLQLSGQDPAEVTRVFDELDSLTRGTYVTLKEEIDTYYSKRYKLPTSELMPWHYQNRYFQEAPEIYALDFDSYYADKYPVEIARAYYATIGLCLLIQYWRRAISMKNRARTSTLFQLTLTGRGTSAPLTISGLTHTG
jgi:hypothetical protein